MKARTHAFDGHASFLVWVAGIDQVLLGLAMLLLPWQFGDARYDALNAYLALFGTLLTLTGVGLVACQVLPTRSARIPEVSRLASAFTFALLSLAFARAHSWAGTATYGLLGAALLSTAFRGTANLAVRLHADPFMLVVALEQGVYGALILLRPDQFLSPSLASLRPYMGLWGLAMLVSGALLGLWLARGDRSGRCVLAALAATPLLLWTYEFGVRGGFVTTVLTMGCLAGGVLARPVLPPSWLAPPRNRLVNKLTGLSVLSVGTAMVVLVAILLRQTESAYKHRAELDLTVMANVVAHDSAYVVESRMRETLLQSRDPEILGFEPEVQLAFIQRVVQGDPAVSQISISNSNGITTLRSTGEQPNIDRRDQLAGMAEVFRTHRADWDVLVSPTLQVPVLAARVPILGPDGGFAGIYATQVRLTTLAKRLAELPFDKAGRIIIVDDKGRVIAHPDASRVAAQEDLRAEPPVAAALAGHPAPVVYRDAGVRWLSVQVPAPQLGWTVLVERTEASILAPANRARQEALAVLATMLALAIAGAVLLARSFSRPLEELALAADHLADGSAEAELPGDREDEVGDLIRAFRRTQQSLLARTREWERAEEERSRLLLREQAARAEVEALLRATASLGVQAEPEAVLRTLVEQAALLLEADRALYAVLREGRIVIAARWSPGQWLEAGHEPRKTGILWSAWESRRAYRTNDLSSEPRANPAVVEQHQIRSQLSVPLIGPDGQRLGLISLNNSRRPGGFSERDERLLVAICETGAAVLRRAQDAETRLEAERAAARRKQEVEALLEVADQLNAAEAEPEQFLPQVLRVAAELLDVRHAAIAENEGDYVLGRFEWSDGVCRSTNARLPLDASMAGWVIRERRAYRSGDLAREAAPPVTDDLRRAGDTPVLAVPILARDNAVLGVLTLSDPKDELHFSDQHQRLAEGIAHHVAAALERAKLIQELRYREEHLRHQAVTDPLTGLPNRGLFLERLERTLGEPRPSGRYVAVLFLDLDGFKTFNDTLGHPAGDKLLRAMGERLVSSQRGDDTVARFGGDEFAVLLESIGQPSDAFSVAERILALLRVPLNIDDRELVLRASIGIALSDADTQGQTAEDLLREADVALYEAKARGKGQFVLFEPSMSATNLDRLELHDELRRALDNRELRVHYQPVVVLSNGTIVGTEALLRWKHPRSGFVEPQRFIPAMEETGLMVPIGRWMLREACRQAQDWHTRRPDAPPLIMSLNVSAQQLTQADFAEDVATALRETRLFPGSLELEFTETAVMLHPEATAATSKALRALGVRLAIDNFGTGYSSLDHVERLAPDRLKIERALVRRLGQDGSSAAIIGAVITLAEQLKIDVIAEGVETAEQAASLREAGCGYGQGSYFSPPLPRRETGMALDQLSLPAGPLDVPAVKGSRGQNGEDKRGVLRSTARPVSVLR